MLCVCVIYVRTLKCCEKLSAICDMQRWECWKQESVKGGVKHGQGYVRTPETAIVSVGTGKVLSVELVMLNSQGSHASATSIVDFLSTTAAASSFSIL